MKCLFLRINIEYCDIKFESKLFYCEFDLYDVNWFVLFGKIASKRERRQYNKRADKGNKLTTKVALLALSTANKTAKSQMSEQQQQQQHKQAQGKYQTSISSSCSASSSSNVSSSSTSPLVHQTSSSLQNRQANELAECDDLQANIMDMDEFVKCLHANDVDYNERVQMNLEQTGLIKRLISMNYGKPTNVADASKSLKKLVVDLLDGQCKALITWARRVPDFDNLSIEDQTYSIESNFLEIILIDCIWRSLNANGQQSPAGQHQQVNKYRLVMHDYFSLDRPLCRELDIEDIYDYLMYIVNRLAQFHLTRDEYVCLKALSLFKSEHGFMQTQKLDQLRQKSSCILKQSCMNVCRANRANQSTDNRLTSLSYRYETILLLLVDIKSIGMKLMHTMAQYNDHYKIELPNLLCDMLKSNTFNIGGRSSFGKLFNHFYSPFQTFFSFFRII